MKYKNILDSKIEQEYNSIQNKNAQNHSSRMKDSDKQYEWYVMVLCLTMPEETAEQIFEKFALKFPGLKFLEYEKVLKAVNLDVPMKRRYILKVVKEVAKDFRTFLNGDIKAAKKVGEYLDNLIERDTVDKRMYFKAKYLLTYLLIIDDKLKNDRAEIILSNYLEVYCGKVLRSVYKDVSQKIGMKRSTKDVIASTQKALDASNISGNLDESSDSSTIIEDLNFQVNNYRNTLDLVQSMFDDLKDSVEESAEEAKKIAVSDFFASLNAQEYGNILDNLLTVEKRLNDLRINNIRLPQEAIPLSIIFKQLIRFVKDYGIEPIETVGRVFDASYHDISFLNYQGEPYQGDDEIKNLQVAAPGWRYKDIVISLPTVREAESNE